MTSDRDGTRPSSMEIQFRALREALDHAGQSAHVAEETTRRARAELHNERTKSSCFQFKIDELTRKLNATREELKAAGGQLKAAREELRAAREELKTAHQDASIGDELEAARDASRQAVEENKRLRNNVGELCRERDELKRLCAQNDILPAHEETPPGGTVIGEKPPDASSLDPFAKMDAGDVTYDSPPKDIRHCGMRWPGVSRARQ